MPPIVPPDMPLSSLLWGVGRAVDTEDAVVSVLAVMAVDPIDSEDADGDTGSDVVGVADA